jgi:hypothetical protein
VTVVRLKKTRLGVRQGHVVAGVLGIGAALFVILGLHALDHRKVQDDYSANASRSLSELWGRFNDPQFWR